MREHRCFSHARLCRNHADDGDCRCEHGERPTLDDGVTVPDGRLCERRDSGHDEERSDELADLVLVELEHEHRPRQCERNRHRRTDHREVMLESEEYGFEQRRFVFDAVLDDARWFSVRVRRRSFGTVRFFYRLFVFRCHVCVIGSGAAGTLCCVLFCAMLATYLCLPTTIIKLPQHSPKFY